MSAVPMEHDVEDGTLITAGGLARLEQELEGLRDVGRQELAERFRTARNDGDVAENPALHRPPRGARAARAADRCSRGAGRERAGRRPVARRCGGPRDVRARAGQRDGRGGRVRARRRGRGRRGQRTRVARRSGGPGAVRTPEGRRRRRRDTPRDDRARGARRTSASVPRSGRPRETGFRAAASLARAPTSRSGCGASSRSSARRSPRCGSCLPDRRLRLGVGAGTNGAMQEPRVSNAVRGGAGTAPPPRRSRHRAQLGALARRAAPAARRDRGRADGRAVRRARRDRPRRPRPRAVPHDRRRRRDERGDRRPPRGRGHPRRPDPRGESRCGSTTSRTTRDRSASRRTTRRCGRSSASRSSCAASPTATSTSPRRRAAATSPPRTRSSRSCSPRRRPSRSRTRGCTSRRPAGCASSSR